MLFRNAYRRSSIPTCLAVGDEEDAEAAREVDALAAELRASAEWAVSAS